MSPDDRELPSEYQLSIIDKSTSGQVSNLGTCAAHLGRFPRWTLDVKNDRTADCPQSVARRLRTSAMVPAIGLSLPSSPVATRANVGETARATRMAGWP